MIKVGRRPVLIAKLMSRNKPLTPKEASTLISAMKSYRRVINEAGVKVPKHLLSLPIKIKGKSSYAILSIDQFILGSGENAHDILRKGKPKAIEDTYKKLLETVHRISNAKTTIKGLAESESPLFLDPKPHNFVLSTKGEIYYVDFFLPWLRSSESRKMIPFLSKMHELSRDELTFRFGDKRGMYLILLMNAIMANKMHQKEFETQTTSFLRERGENKVADFIFKWIENGYYGEMERYIAKRAGKKVKVSLLPRE